MVKKVNTQDLRHTYDQILFDEFAKSITKDYDQELMMSMLVTYGWFSVKLKTIPFSKEFYDWIKTNIKGGYHQLNGNFIFENEQDANWFKMRWLT